MEILSYIPDYRIKASNVLIQMSIQEYLDLAESVIDANEFQRRRVITSRLKSTLKSDLKQRCTIPPIVLGVRDSQVPENFQFQVFNDDKTIKSFFDGKAVIILDGLQRTYVLLELQKEDPEGQWLQSNIRCEVFVGMEKLGILYRMLTLNTGQTTMSTRHLLEILYFDYLNIDIEGITLVLDKDDDNIGDPLNEFKFKEVIEGYNSFIDGREVPIERADILQNIETISSLERTSDEKEGFKSFLLMFHKLLNKLNEQNEFKYNYDDIKGTEFDLGSSPFGRTIPQIFGRSQSLSGLGAALHHLKKYRDKTINTVFEADIDSINNITNDSLHYLLKTFDYIRNKSKKVGNDQRYFFKYLYISLFDRELETYLDFDSSIRRATIRVEEKIES